MVSHCAKWVHQKLNIELPYDSPVPHLGIYPKEVKEGFSANIGVPILIAAFFFFYNGSR
jgi:hypothetical protein